MSGLFKNPEILDCSLCFEQYSELCPEHKLSIAFKEDTYLEKCVNLLVKERVQTALEELRIYRNKWWQLWKPNPPKDSQL